MKKAVGANGGGKKSSGPELAELVLSREDPTTIWEVRTR